jgi:hypothetical protein
MLDRVTTTKYYRHFRASVRVAIHISIIWRFMMARTSPHMKAHGDTTPTARYPAPPDDSNTASTGGFLQALRESLQGNQVRKPKIENQASWEVRKQAQRGI